MKIIQLLIVILLSAGISFAQLGYGVEGGIGMASMRFAPLLSPIHYTAGNASPIFSGKVGFLADVPMNKHIYFQSGLYFSRKGAVRSFSYYANDSFNESVNQTLNINYFDVPLTVMYKSGMLGKGRFTAGIGAVLSYIAGGKNKLHDHQVFNDTLSDTNDTYNISVGNTLKGFDIGVNLTAGYELPTGLFFRTYYVAGTKDIGPGTEIDKNRMWGISAGYIFGKGRNINKEADDLIDKTTE